MLGVTRKNVGTIGRQTRHREDHRTLSIVTSSLVIGIKPVH